MPQAGAAHTTYDVIPQASGVYQIRNRTNGKVYVGSAVNLRKRQRSHWDQLRKGSHHSRHLQSAWDLSGEASFEWQVLEFCERDQLLQVEQKFIDLHQAADRRFGYNSRPRAESNLGHKFSPETVEKNRRAQTGRKQSPETIARRTGGQKGRKFPPSWCAAIAAAKTGQPRPDIKKWAPERFRRFDAQQVRDIQAMRAGGQTLAAIASKYGCVASTVLRALRGEAPAYRRVNHL